MDGATTSLDPLETSDSRLPSNPFVSGSIPAPPDLPSPLRSIRDSILSVLKDLSFRGLVPMRRFSAFDDCGSRYVLLRNKENRSLYRLCSTSCHDRLCPGCGAQRGRDLAAGLQQILRGKDWRFLTLTLAGPNTSLDAALHHLYDSFRRLRKLPMWRAKVSGGVAILEVTFNKELGSWHPHLHVLATGIFYPQQALSNDWYEATRDSKIVHITMVRSHRAVGRYLTDYLSKPVPESVLATPALIEEAALALASVRRIVAFGSCHGHTRLKDDGESEWQRVGDVAILLRNDDTDPELRLILRACLKLALDEGTAIDFEHGPDP